MRSILRPCLVTFLVLLQLVAPLVHAHAGKMAFSVPSTGTGKLHVPGLEILVSTEADNRQYSLATIDVPSEGVIFGIDAGIKQHQDNGLSDADVSYYLHQKTIVFNLPVSPFDNNFSPQASAVICRLPVFSHSPRAPPVQ